MRVVVEASTHAFSTGMQVPEQLGQVSGTRVEALQLVMCKEDLGRPAPSRLVGVLTAAPIPQPLLQSVAKRATATFLVSINCTNELPLAWIDANHMPWC